MSCSHGRQPTPSSAPEVNPPGELLTIGELARQTGVAASALRYYEEVGLLPAPARVSGQRHYPESAVTIVAAIRLHSDAGFTPLPLSFRTYGACCPVPGRFDGTISIL